MNILEWCESELLLFFLIVSCGYLPVLGSESTTTTTTISNTTNDPFRNRIPVFNISWDDSEKEALDKLLDSFRYDNRSIPPLNGALEVKVSVLLLSMASPDESSLKYEVEFLMNMEWEDLRLRYFIWNETSTDGGLDDENTLFNFTGMPMRLDWHRKREYLDALHHHERVWKPDVYYVKHGDFRQNLDPVHLALQIFGNGTINFETRRHLILSCKGNFPYFPFDDPHCGFAVESVSYERDRLKLHWETDKGVLRKSGQLSEVNAYLRSNATESCFSKHNRGDFPCLEVQLVFARDRAFYFTTVFIPDIILVTSSMITFWLEWNAVPARIMLGVTTMLNFFTTSNSFRATLPVVSNLTAMNIWDGFSMFFIYAALLEFIFVNYVGRKRPRRIPIGQLNEKTENKLEVNEPVVCGGPSSPNKHPTTTQIMACTACSPSPSTHPVNNSCSAGQQLPLRQRMVENPVAVAKTIDVVSRIVFPTAYAIFLISFFACVTFGGGIKKLESQLEVKQDEDI